MSAAPDHRSVRPEALSGRERYDLLTSVVVPRPIGWISTQSADGLPNLAPYSFFAGLSANPPLIGVSIGLRRGEPKDTLNNIRATGGFCVNVCSEEFLEEMNLTSGEYPASVNEFDLAGLTPVAGEEVRAPWVGEARATFECELFKEVELGEGLNTLVVGRVRVFHLAPSLQLLPGSWIVDPLSLRPVGRLGRDRYSLPGEIKELPRPKLGRS